MSPQTTRLARRAPRRGPPAAAAFLIAALLVPSAAIRAASPTVDWNVTYSHSATNNDSYIGSCTDSSGNTFVLSENGGTGDYELLEFDSAGSLAGALPLDPPPGVVLPSAMTVDAGGDIYATGLAFGSDLDVAVVKWNSAGAVVWSKQYDTGLEDWGHNIAVDGSGNVFAAGYSYDSLFIVWDATIVKYDSAGTFQWGKAVDYGFYDMGLAVTTDGAGNAYLAGATAPPFFFSWVAFVTKFSPAGTVLFSRTYSGIPATDEAYARAIVHRAADSSLHLGWDNYNDGVGMAQVSDSTGDSLGAVLSVGTPNRMVGGVAVDGAGNTYISGPVCCDIFGTNDLFVGGYSGFATMPGWPVNYDSGKDEAYDWPVARTRVGVDASGAIYASASADASGGVCAAGDDDVVVRKLTSAGAVTWTAVHDPPAGAGVTVAGAAVDASGDPYVGVRYGADDSTALLKFNRSGGGLLWDRFHADPGYCGFQARYDAVAHFGGETYVSMDALNIGTFRTDLVVAKYDTAGNPTGSFVYDGLDNLDAGPIAVDGTGNTYLAASFYSATTFEWEMLLVKFDPTGAVLWTVTRTFADLDDPLSMTLDEAGNGYVVEEYPFDGTDPTSCGVLKFSGATGDVLWTQVVPGVAHASTMAAGVAASGAGIYISGFDTDGVYGPSTAAVARLTKMDSSGNVVWSASRPGSPDSRFNGMTVAAGGTIFVTGAIGTIAGASGDVFTMSYDPSGNERWSHTYDSGDPDDAGVYAAAYAAAGSVYAAAESAGDLRLIKYMDIGPPPPPANLTATVTVAPPTAALTQTITVMLTVRNTGSTAASGVTPSAGAGPAPAALVSPLGGPSPAGPVTINPGAAATFSWTYQAGNAGSLDFTATASGLDDVSKTPVSAAGTSPPVTIAPPAALAAAVSAGPSQVRIPEAITVVLTVSNTGGIDATGVFPAAAGPVPPNLASRVGGPVPPVPVTIAGGSAQFFTWTYQASGFGDVRFTATVSGTDGFSKAPVGAAAMSPKITIIPMAILEASMTISPAPAREREEFVVTLTVSNNGNAAASSVSPSLALGDQSLAHVIGPPANSGGVAIPPNGSAVFTWRLRADSGGVLDLSAVAAGLNDTDGQPVSAAVRTPLTIEKRFTEEIVAFPNPVSGDALTVFVRLDADATELHVNVFNSAFRRVFSGTWRDLGRLDAEVGIAGVRSWAPGIYIIRAEAVLANGTWKEFPVAKVMVKR